MQLSFVVQQKKKPKVKFNVNALICAVLVFVAVMVNILLGIWLGLSCENWLNSLIKPPFYVASILSAVISVPVIVIAGIGVHFSVMFEKNKKQVVLFAIATFVLNIAIIILMFVFNLLALSLLAIVSNIVVCCYYFKQLKPRSLGQLMFIPYIIWLLFNTVVVYSLFLLN